MKHLFFQLNKLKDSLKSAPVFLFLDYDGTLAPIAESPDKAVISVKTREILSGLSKDPRCKVAVISGRALKDIKRKIGLKGIVYSGNHGLEIEGPKIKFKAPVSFRYAVSLKKIKAILKSKLSKIKGVIIEDKGLTLSVHYRLARPKDAWLVKTVFNDTLARYIVSGRIKMRTGKKVLEISPPLEWDKGNVALWLLDRWRFAVDKEPCLPVYIGDDVTDEDAFKVLRGRGLTIFVGEHGRSSAEYYLRNTAEVAKLLGYVLKIKQGDDVCRN